MSCLRGPNLRVNKLVDMRVSRTQQHISYSSSQVIESYFYELHDALSRLSTSEIATIVTLLGKARLTKRQVFLFGNGGSASTASHFACDLAKGIQVNGRPGIRAVALTDNVALMSAWANDSSYDEIFARQLRNHVEPGDIAIGISGSGRSPNVLNGIREAKLLGATTIGFTGFDGGELKGLVDYCVIVPKHSLDLVEDVHLMLGHTIAACLRDADF